MTCKGVIFRNNFKDNSLIRKDRKMTVALKVSMLKRMNQLNNKLNYNNNNLEQVR